MNNIIKNIILLVASAQMHSDEGKIERNSRRGRGEQLIINFTGSSCKYAYSGKDQAILAAIKIINSHPMMGVKYYIKNNGDNSIVYFNFLFKGEKLQVSFHTFNEKIKKLNGKGSPCRWDKKDSRETCCQLLKNIGIESDIKLIINSYWK